MNKPAQSRLDKPLTQTSRALAIAAILALVLVVPNFLDYKSDFGLSYGESVVTSTIPPTLIFFVGAASLAFFQSTRAQRIWILAATVFLSLVPILSITLFDVSGTPDWSNIPIYFIAKFGLSFTGISTVAAAIVYSIWGLGKATRKDTQNKTVGQSSTQASTPK